MNSYYAVTQHAALFSRPIDVLVKEHYIPLASYLREYSRGNRYCDLITAGDRLFLDGNFDMAERLLFFVMSSIPLGHEVARANARALYEEAVRIKKLSS